MKNRLKCFAGALMISGMFLTGLGAYLKYWLLRPVGLLQDKAAVAVPFMVLSDETLREDTRLTAEPLLPVLPDIVPTVNAIPEETEPVTELLTTPAVTTEPSALLETQPTFSVEIDQSIPGEIRFLFSGPAVDDDWFEDVLFIGDSRTCGLRDFARSGEADYFCDIGMNVFNVTRKACTDSDFGYQNLKGVLQFRKYGKIFINLGINEAGSNLDGVMEAYSDLIVMVREEQPDAVVILQSVMTLSRRKSSSTSYFGLDNLSDINQRIEALADGEKVIFIDANEIFADEEGYLPDVLSGDGCHLYAKYDLVWEQWIRHTVAEIGI